MTLRKSNTYLSLVNSYLIDSPQPSSINYWWNVGSLLGLCLVIQLASGIFLAMHYSSNIELAFNSVEHIMRDVNAGWLIRYIHANGASFFFICLYLHIGKALYYGSYRSPRVLLWTIGVIIFILTMATAFMGYCLVYGQMSHWGNNFALNVITFIIFIFTLIDIISMPIIWMIYHRLCRHARNAEKLKIVAKGDMPARPASKYLITKDCTSRKSVTNFNEPWPFKDTKILEIIYGSLLGDSHAEKRKGGKGTRITFYQEGSHEDYLLYLHSLIANLGFCNTKIPKISTRLGKKGKIRKIIRFTTWTYDQFNIIHTLWYNEGKKILPYSLRNYFTPLALAIWIMDDGGKVGSGLKLSTNNFTKEEVDYLVFLLKDIFNIDSNRQSAGCKDQYCIYIIADSMPTLVNIVKPYIIPSMKYKFGKYF